MKLSSASFYLLVASVAAENVRKAKIPRIADEDKVTEYIEHQRKLQDINVGGTLLQCTVVGDSTPQMPGTSSRFCVDNGVAMSNDAAALLANVPGSSEFLKYFDLYQAEGYTVGSITDLVVEAGDAAVSGAPIEDGKSGDVAFPYGEIKPIVTAGERSVCPESMGEVIVGKPDGMGAYLIDDETIRVLFQSESYGPLTENEAWAYPVNNGAALIGGSHINYVDYDREMFAKFMSYPGPASDMVVGMGQHIKQAYNLRGEPLSRRNRDGATPVGAHLSNTDAAGNWVVGSLPRIEYDWFYQSFCSAHMEERHQWGPGIGFEDRVYLTNEEWHVFTADKPFVGNSVHALDVATDTIWAVGSLSLGGFEKQAEFNSQHPDYVMVGIAGYNGDYSGSDFTLNARREFYGPRDDGKEYAWPENIVPHRFYLGLKGKMEDGSDAPESDFLARNGLRYGQIYGYAIDMSESGPTGGLFRDAAHKVASNGFEVPGYWVAQPWRWNGTVLDFQHDGSWDFQNSLPVDDLPGYGWWTANGYDSQGAKTEHLSPDTRAGISAFVAGSTAGYFGHDYVDDVAEILSACETDEDCDFPDKFPGRYFVYQAETDIRSQVMLGGKGEYLPDADGNPRNATCNFDNVNNGCKETFEDIDGLEVICGEECCRVVIQEDSGNDLGERCFISSCLEHEADGEELTYYLVAVSGGSDNSRMMAGVGIPKTSNANAGSHEFSGVFDLSGLLKKDGNSFALSVDDEGFYKRALEKEVLFNDKYIMINVQASNMNDRIMVEFGADTGGQVMIYKPRLP